MLSVLKKLAIVGALLWASPAVCQIAAYNGFCQLGGTFVSTVGMNSTTKVQASYPKCTVTVYATGTTNLSTLFSNALSSPLSNPFQANNDGSILFFASTTGCYDIVTSVSTSGGTPPMPNNFTYTDVCLGGGGGSSGGGIGPGTVNQIAKFVSTTNVGNSSGFDDGSSLVQWPNGLTVMGSAYGHIYPNSPNGTTANYLACIDSTQLTVAEVTTCPASTAKAIGIVHAGTAGITGNAQIATLGFDSCVFDNQTVVGDYAGPSTSTGGRCTDLGGTRPASFQGVGRVTTLNNGAGTAAIIDLGPWDLFAPGSTGAGQCAFNNANAYFSGGNLLCDASVTDDGNGNLTAKSLGLTDVTQAGFIYLKQGTQPAAAPLNTRMDTVPSSVTTYTVIHPGVPCSTIGQTEIVQSTSTDSNGHTVVTMTCGTAGGGGVEAQTNGVDNANCTAGVCPLINIIDSTTTPAGLGLTWSNPFGGQWKGVLNDGTTRASNPVIPVATVNGTPGTTDYKYAVAYCQDINCVYHSALSPVVDVSTGAATITSTNSITLANYADTLYGYRFAVVCRTASSGSPASIGVIATGAGKSFIDTGLTGDASNCATTYATNTTILSPLPCLSSFAPGGNSPYGAPCGIDAPPLSPSAVDDEFSEQFGAPGDANNPFWTQINPGTATFTWTGGTLSIKNNAGTDQLNCVFHAAPSTPYGIVSAVYYNVTIGGNVTAFLALRESATQKIEVVGPQIQNGGNSLRINFAKYTNPTTNSSFTSSTVAWISTFTYLKVGNNGTNVELQWSPDGLVYATALNEAKNTFFTTGPDQVGVCVDIASGTGSAEFDYLRKVAF